MSCNYAEGLSDYDDKGICGLPEEHDDLDDIVVKVELLAKWMRESNHTVFHTGAGISTSSGIPDFRGPKGVWTLEEKGIKPQINTSFDEAVPTTTHMALLALEKAGYVHYIVSQNVDGLHLRSGFPASKLSELHGNMFLHKCNKCKRLFVQNTAGKSVGQKNTGVLCPIPKSNNKPCRGTLYDTILDWEDELPEIDLKMAEKHSKEADLSICLGTTLQIIPSGNLPLLTKTNNGKLVICNLQPTKHDKHADLLIHDYVDNIMIQLLKILEVKITPYSDDIDPTRNSSLFKYIERPSVKFIRNDNKCKNKNSNHQKLKEENNVHKKLKLKIS
ncbi:NAD-dependent protein deacetylase Sirt6-like [Centruroides sculpturatus]|uniref:NAD-dependent protein deacetylase Sirt6-like n=1 Tax=Centruroides sculpturatus TaxID=218467 RepID=UPI000C6E51F1|nr:NAD-dependent protein deacetylase Sirt6-like [Centruroides sculpturatus]